mgnify:CR=1 FL=1
MDNEEVAVVRYGGQSWVVIIRTFFNGYYQ